MTSKAEKLLEQMRASKANWKTPDIARLYEGFGFIITHGANHDKVRHPDFPELRTTLPRHRDIAKVYVEIAVKLVDQLLKLQRGGSE
ncbi:hypothetical protein FBQ83_07425 [Chloroflexi bacterium CFX5]|nr:hypothetical protein [Chloroflexota bacterium]MDL1919139.1 hypothetical protein [Chloroflexi bacterium CFX5]NUQ58382.1 hypothetical protein [Anaerolineales bacterium]